MSLVAGMFASAAGCGFKTDGVNPSAGPATPGETSAKQKGREVSQSESQSGIRFREVTPWTGIQFKYYNGEEARHFAILESLGGGVAISDFDRDGIEDLFFPGGGKFTAQQILGRPGALFRNLGEWDFCAVTASANLMTSTHYSHAASMLDFDNDGFPDLLVTGYGGLGFWRNQGDGTFSNATGASGLNDALWSSSAAWGDVNGDGSPDLYVAHYVNWSFENHPFCDGPRPELREVCPPRTFDPLPDSLYLSNSDGTFRDASEEWGLRKDGKGLGVVLADLDLDGDLDVYVTNDTVENFLYENVGGKALRDVSLISGASLSERGVPDGSMGVDLFDYNRDGLPDLWVVNYERESCALYENSGNLMYRHVSQPTGVTAVGGLFVGWGTSCFDMDRDGDDDIFVSNGHVIRYPSNAPLRQKPLVFENLNGRRFRNVAEDSGDYGSSPHMGRGVAAGDLDGDGDLDLAFSHVNEPVAVVSNESAPKGGWLAVDLIGTRSPRDPVGAVVTLRAAGETQARQWRGGGSYASTNSRRLFFGLGRAERIDEVSVQWPSGRRQVIESPEPDRTLRIIEESASP